MESKIGCFIALNFLLINVKVMQGLLLQYVGIMIRWMLCKHTKTVKSKIMELDMHVHMQLLIRTKLAQAWLPLYYELWNSKVSIIVHVIEILCCKLTKPLERVQKHISDITKTHTFCWPVRMYIRGTMFAKKFSILKINP